MIAWFAKLKRFLNGDALDEMVAELKKSSAETSKKIDKLLEQARMDREQLWLVSRKPSKEDFNDSKGSPL